ncbi:leucyl/phenylalanyl-tRNA--protein transferase [Legionella septentrionalis]|uniref:Leucyl/phenylalanyl-tRNA--protein transferase n=1 Tax=Legionella septentrionalis TaxID=2498109 RepID=A0A433JKE7_9GAMM|nr:leucyl/phenylalanyl-tRNA--protein transferase [Legionella septentrionalis]RUQ89049.1 leucyl/phenylalanyl-tRNA--protein transferase [Legionella septentrionalis]RUR00620.1 leucyl/phenylalanyl-tRNA--protein transferase [Legionella septentrionalis]RUR11787.1 leucyl/phenylalanyl-tRNA--protein transferase [Legionella septentrionalis]
MLTADDYSFPNPETADAEGLVAIGGDLSPKRILEAYRHGIFPWFNPGDPILWWSPDPRLILKPHAFKLTRSLKKTLNKPFRFTIDTAFSDVIRACASTGKRLNRSWITAEMIAAYTKLYEMGFAHSFEVWLDGKLVGGLYGISLGRIFFGESMFHDVRDASKLALYFLCQTLQELKFEIIDCQLPTAHLQSLGAETICRHEFLQWLQKILYS